MPINLIDYSDFKVGEKGIPIGYLCEDEWEMPKQIAALEDWLNQNKEKI